MATGNWCMAKPASDAPELFDLAADIGEQHDLAVGAIGEGARTQVAVGRLERGTGFAAKGQEQGRQEGQGWQEESPTQIDAHHLTLA